MEQRTFDLDSNVKKGTISGYASVFDVLSEPFMGMREKVKKGAFQKTIQKDTVVALFNHNVDFVLGKTSANTLKLSEDDHGLYFEIYPPDTQFAQDLLKSIRRGDINKASFGFSISKESWARGETPIRTLEEVKLYDISPVVFPAYPQTEISASTRCKILEMKLKPQQVIPSWKELSRRIQKKEKELFEKEMEFYRKFFKIEKGGK